MTRVGASQAFFNIVASFNANKLIKDINSLDTIMKAVAIDTFEAMMKPFDEFGQMIGRAREAVEELGIEVGNARIEFEKFFGGSSVVMQSTADAVIELGEAYAMTATDSLAAASRAAQVANLIGSANVELLVQQAMVLAEISDLNVEESQRALIKLQSQANILYGDYTEGMMRGMPLERQREVLLENSAKALDALNTIANRSVALEGDLVQTMTNFASQGHLVGESFEFMAAASATLLEAGEEQGTAGRALRMMYARLGGNISGAADEMEALGIQVRDSNGDIMTMEEVLGNVSEKGWDNMSSSLKMNIAQTISGNRHYVRFIKLMDNYQRTVRLAEEGQMGLDSAADQANRALRRQSHDLQESQVRIENLKASIGEGLTPAFTAANKVQGDYLEFTRNMITGTGELGKVMGKLGESLKVTGGFVKFGLAIQSVGIGVGMYESVMKSLHNIQVANASLHSKQANYLQFGVELSRSRKYIMEGMQFIQQKMNAASEQQRMRQLSLNDLLRQEKEIKELTEPLEEKVNANLTKRANLSQKITSLNQLQTDLSKRQMSSYQTKKAFMEHDYRIQGDLYERQKELYSTRTFEEDAYKRQFISDVTTMSALRKGDLKDIKTNNHALKQRHSTLQDLKAANEAARAARNLDNDAEIRTNALKKQDQKQILEFLAKEQAFVDGHVGRLEKLKNAGKDYNQQELSGYEKRQRGLTQLAAQVDNMGKGLFKVGAGGLGKAGFDELTNALRETGGFIIQNDRVLQAYNETLLRNGSIEKNLQIIRGMKTKTGKALVVDQAKLNQLMKEDATLQTEMLPLLEAIGQMEKEKIADSKEFLQLTDMLIDKELEYAGIKEKYTKKQTQEIEEANKRTQQSMQQLAFAGTSLVSVLGGMVGGSLGIAASFAAMGSQIAFAGGQVVKSTKSLFENSVQAAINTGMFDEAAIGLEGEAAGLAKSTAARKHYTKAFIKGGVVIAAATAALFIYNEEVKRQQERIQDVREEIDQLASVQEAMERDTKLFGDNDALAEELGLANLELGELYDNTKLASYYMEVLENGSLGLDRNLQSVVENSKDLLEYMMQIQEGSMVQNQHELRKAKRAVADARGMSVSGTLDTVGGFLNPFDESNTYGDDKAKIELARSVGLQTDKLEDVFQFGFAKRISDHMIEGMENGTEYTMEQWDLLGEALGDADWANELMTNMEKIDMLTMSSRMLEIQQNKLADSTSGVTTDLHGQTEEIKNLTDELYNFSDAREELFFGGKYGNVTGSLYKQVVKQGVGVLYNKQEVIVSNVFHGFFNEKEAGDRISRHVEQALNNFN